MKGMPCERFRRALVSAQAHASPPGVSFDGGSEMKNDVSTDSTTRKARSEEHETIDHGRRKLAKKIAYVAPVVATLSVTPKFAQQGSGTDDDGGF